MIDAILLDISTFFVCLTGIIGFGYMALYDEAYLECDFEIPKDRTAIRFMKVFFAIMTLVWVAGLLDLTGIYKPL